MAKYWCKPCKTFVVDTKLGRNQHEVSGRHKASMARTLRELHHQKAETDRNEKTAKRLLESIERSVGSGSRKPPTSVAHITPSVGPSRPPAAQRTKLGTVMGGYPPKPVIGANRISKPEPSGKFRRP